jgi:hypothetical protein
MPLRAVWRAMIVQPGNKRVGHMEHTDDMLLAAVRYAPLVFIVGGCSS